MSLLLDTHAAIFYFTSASELSVIARNAIEGSLHAGESLFISAISIAEIVYLIDKRRLPASALSTLLAAAAQPVASLRVLPFETDKAAQMLHVPRAEVPDFPDRLIAATALQHSLPLVTKDHKIRLSQIQTIW